MTERDCEPECLAQVESHVDKLLIIKLYEFIIQANIELSPIGVVSASVVAEMLNDDKASVTANAILFLWETIRNNLVLKTKKPEAFPIERMLAAIPQTYFQTHPEAIDTLLQLKDETGAFVFLGLADFLGQAAKVVLATNIVCQDLCDIDSWFTFKQTVTINNAAGVRNLHTSIVTADDVFAVGRIYAGLDYRKNQAALAASNIALVATNIDSDGVVAPAVTDTTTFGQRLGYYANSLGAGSDVGLLSITTAPTITAGGDLPGLVFLVSGSAANQHVGGLPAIYSYLPTANANALGAPTMLAPGTGWRDTASTSAGTLIFNLASNANLLAAGYTAAEIEESYLNTATGTVTLTSTGAVATILSVTALQSAPIAAAVGVTGIAGLGLASIDATGRTGTTGLSTTVPNTFLVSGSSALQAQGAKPAIVRFAVVDGDSYGAATILEPGENWISGVTVAFGNTTFVLATEATLRTAGYLPESKYISGTVTGFGTVGGATTGVVGIVDSKVGAGLFGLNSITLAGAGLNGNAAASINSAFFVLATGLDATAQLPGSQPAIVQFTLTSNAASTAAVPTVLAPGTGFLPGARKAGQIKFTIATAANLRAAGYVPNPQTNFSTFNAGTITQNTTIEATLSNFTSSTTTLLKREFARSANKVSMPVFTFPPASDVLYLTAALYNAPRLNSFEGPPIVAAKTALELVKPLPAAAKATATQLKLVELLLANAEVKPSAFTLIFINLINSVLLKTYFAATKLADIVTFIGNPTANDETPDFNMKYYNILSPVQLTNTDISFLYGLYAVLSTLGYLAEEVLKATRVKLVATPIQAEGGAVGATLAPPVHIRLRANDFDRFYSGYIKTQPLARRLSLFNDLLTIRAPVEPSAALLLANEDIVALYKEVYDNSRELKARYTQLVATNVHPYEQQVAKRVKDLASAGTRSITGIKSLTHNAGATILKGSLLTASSTATGTGKAVFLINKNIVLINGATTILAGDLTLLSTTVGGFASNFTTVPLNTNTHTPALATAAFTAVTIVTSAVYEFSEPIPQSSVFKFGGLVFDEDNLFVKSDLFAGHVTGFYTLDIPTSDGSGAPATGPATLASIASEGDYKTSPTLAAGPLTVRANLNKLYHLLSAKFGIPIWMIIVAAAAGNTTLLGAQLLMIELFNTVLAKKNLVSVIEILHLPKGPWSNALEPIEVLVSIVRDERALFIDVKPYIEAVLNFAKSNLFDTVRAVNTQGNELVVTLMDAARDDVDRSNIFLMMGTAPEIQLANLTNILSLIKMPKIKLFSYYFAQFTMAQLIDGLPLIETSPGLPTSTSACTSYWHTLFNSLEGIKQLQPYVSAENLLSYERSVKPINIVAGTSSSATTSLTFNPTFIISAYYPGDTLVAGTIKLNALVADLGLSFV